MAAQFIQIGGLTLHYSFGGNRAGKPLVFINSLGSDFRIWDKMLADFAPHFQIIRYDKRGHGLSDAPPAPYTIRDHTNDLAGLLEQLAIPRVILVGISVGGLIAQDFALAYPERTQAPAFFEQQPAQAQGYYNMLSRTPLEGYIGTCMALREADLRSELGNIKAKTLVLCGAEDKSTPPSLGWELAQGLQGRFELIEKAGHLPCIEQPGAMSQKILSFFLGEERHGREV